MNKLRLAPLYLPLVSEKAAAEFLGRSLSSIRRDRKNHTGPAYVQIGRSIRYRIADLEAYIEAHASSGVRRA